MSKHILNKLGFGRIALVVASAFPLLFLTSAKAQEAEAARVIVTGSNIPTAEEQASIPVTTYTAEWLRKGGSQTPVEGLRQLPTFVGNAATENDSNAGDGTAFINLRGLGAENTLTLYNGRRVLAGADINLLSFSQLYKADVLKDGASAIYGSDAVAGVVNMMFWNDVHSSGPIYEGAEMEILYGNTTDTDAGVRRAWMRGGVQGLDNKVAIFASAEYYDRSALYSLDRVISSTGDRSNSGFVGLNPPVGAASLGLGGTNQNSPTFAGRVQVANWTPPGGSTPIPGNTQLVLQNLSENEPTAASYRRFEPSRNPANPMVPPCCVLPGDFPTGTDPARFNFRAFTPAIPPMEKYMQYVTGRYKVFDDALELYSDFMYSHSRQDNGLAGAPFALGGAVGRTSQFNPFGASLSNVLYRLQTDLGNRRSTFEKDYWRWVVGAKGEFNFKGNDLISRFGYDAGAAYERFEEEEIDSGDAVRSRINDEIAAGNFNPFIGQNAPTSGMAPTYDAMGNPTGMAAYDNVAAAGRASYIGHSFFRNKFFTLDATTSASFLPNLWQGGFDVAIGYNFAERYDQQIGDPVQAAGDQLGFNQVPNKKFRREFHAAFGELKLPIIIPTNNVPFVNLLEIGWAYRYEAFRDENLTAGEAHGVNSYIAKHDGHDGTNRVTIGYRPIKDLLLRGTWGESFRSPDLPSQFDPTFQDFPQVFDPLNHSTLQPPGGVWVTGNRELRPEETSTWTLGFVYSPNFLPGLTVTADWYDIFTKDLIISGEDFAQVMLTANGKSGGTAFRDTDGYGLDSGVTQVCGPSQGTVGGPNLGVTRDLDGSLCAIDTASFNAGKRHVQGLDISANYEIPSLNLWGADWGKYIFTLGYNHFFVWKAQTDPFGPFTNFNGDYNNGTLPLAPGAIPFNKGFARFEWEYKLGPGNVDFVATGNYIGDYRDDNAFVIKPPLHVLGRRVSEYITLDLQASYEFVRPPAPAAAEVAGYTKGGKDMKSPVGKQPASPAMEDHGAFWERMLWGTTITGGVVNAFDRNPPSVLGAFNDNYDTRLYSIRNRFYYVSLRKRF